jgi:DeoR/GlpR family transcriptional regulator of sugar metabolism
MAVEGVERLRLGEARRQRVRELLTADGAVTIAELRARFGISPMTARRDLAVLEQQGLARRTHGGAVLPPVAAQENSFAQRLGTATAAKQRLADAAVGLLEPGETLFLDSSSTAYFVARRIAQLGLAARIVTNCGAIMQTIAACEHEHVELFAIGGTLRRLTGSYVGPSAVRVIREHYADRAVLSVMGIARNGTLMDGDPLEAEVKRAMVQQSAHSLLLVDASKLTARGRQAVVPLKSVSQVLADGLTTAGVERLLASGARRVTTA